MRQGARRMELASLGTGSATEDCTSIGVATAGAMHVPGPTATAETERCRVATAAPMTSVPNATAQEGSAPADTERNTGWTPAGYAAKVTTRTPSIAANGLGTGGLNITGPSGDKAADAPIPTSDAVATLAVEATAAASLTVGDVATRSCEQVLRHVVAGVPQRSTEGEGHGEPRPRSADCGAALVPPKGTATCGTKGDAVDRKAATHGTSVRDGVVGTGQATTGVGNASR